jgi:hypothetical protein
LTGVDRSETRDAYGWSAEHFSFILDGTTYTAMEDGNDGYRSTMGDLIVSDTKLTTTFPPVPVVAIYLGEDADLLEIIHANTGQPIILVGTDYTDDYYPYFVAEYDPLALSEDQA